MQEIDAVVSQIMPAIGAAVSAYGLGVLTRAEDEAAGVTVRLGQRLLSRILHRAKDPEPVRAAITDLAQDHSDPDALAALRLQVRKVLSADADLARELSSWLPRAAFHSARSRGVVVEGGNTGIVATGDGTINIQRT